MFSTSCVISPLCVRVAVTTVRWPQPTTGSSARVMMSPLSIPGFLLLRSAFTSYLSQQIYVLVGVALKHRLNQLSPLSSPAGSPFHRLFR